MKAIVCREFGPVERLEYRDVPDPIPAAGQILIDVAAAGVNFPDGLIVQGQYQLRPTCPFIPGSEVAGRVNSLGPGVSDFRVGERVMAFSLLGGYAEKVAVAAASAVRIPDDVPDHEAAGLLIAHSTAHHALRQRAQLREGETLLITGAAGGTGLAAVQIGKAIGARVIALCSTDEKLALARAHGADDAIRSGQGDLKAALKNLLDGRGVDVVYDTVGGDTFDVLSRCMAWEGRLLVVGFASGRIPQLPVNLALVKGYSLVGVFWGSFTQQQPGQAAANMRELLQWYAQKKVRVVVDSILPLAQAGDAIRRLTNREAAGKIVLQV